MGVAGMRDFSWSPTENTLAYWVAEDKDVPARVTLVEIPSRNELRVKNLFNVADCKMHWQKTGDYLCVKVDRYSKLRKEKEEVKYAGLYFNFEVFHMREKQIPVDSVEIKENVEPFLGNLSGPSLPSFMERLKICLLVSTVSLQVKLQLWSRSMKGKRPITSFGILPVNLSF